MHEGRPEGLLKYIKWNLNGLKYTFMIIALMFAGTLSFFVVTMWKPFEAFCLSRIDTDEKVSDWCWRTPLPEIYSFV